MHGAHQQIGAAAAVEAGVAMIGQALQGAGQLGLTQQAVLGGCCVIGQEYARGLRVCLHGLEPPADAFAIQGIDTNAIAGQALGRIQAVTQCQLAVALAEVNEGRRQARYGGRQGAVQ